MHPALRRVREAAEARPATVLAVVLLSGAAVVGALYLAAPSSEPESPADAVPESVSYVGHLDAVTMRSSQGVEDVTGEAAAFQSAVDFYDGPPVRRSYLFRESNLSADAVDEVTYFGRANTSYRARLVSADWRTAELVAVVEADANATLTAENYGDRQLYAGDGVAVAVVENGTFAVGNGTAVRDAVDVAAGEREPVSGPLRTRFEDRAGYFRFAFRFRPETVPEYEFVGGSIRSVEYVATEYRVNGSNVATESVVVTEDADSARSVKGLLAFARTIYGQQTENETLAAELGKLRFDVEGNTVVSSYESTPERYRVLLRGLYYQQPETA